LRVGGHRSATADIATGRLWQIAVLTAASAIGAASQANAALYYWPASEPGYYQPGPAQGHRQKARRQNTKKDAPLVKETGSKPQGPLIISVSINKQQVKIYDANGFFAEAPVSTGMRG